MGTFQDCPEPYCTGPLAWEHFQMKTACGSVQEGRQCPGAQVHASLTLTLPAKNLLPWSPFPSHPPIISLQRTANFLLLICGGVMTFEVCCHGSCLKSYLLFPPTPLPSPRPQKLSANTGKAMLVCLLPQKQAGRVFACSLSVSGAAEVESQLPLLAALHRAQSFWGLLWEEHSFGLWKHKDGLPLGYRPIIIHPEGPARVAHKGTLWAEGRGAGRGCLQWMAAHFILPERKWRKGPLDSGMGGPGLGPDPAAQVPFPVLLLQALQDAPGRALGPTGLA